MKRLAVVLLILAGVWLLLMLTGRWRSTGVGSQVQVPMFYDAHYLFPRPWTQEQAAPGVPDPAPVATLYGPNRLTQAFTAGADRLSTVGLWLAGPAGTPVEVSMSLPGGTVYGGRVVIEEPAGEMVYFSFPTVGKADGETFVLTLAAPEADGARPVIVRAIGGDRLGGSIRLNEYFRPGNLELFTYSQGGLPGRWWLDAVGEQILAAVFRLRVQQYKPPAFKGNLFSGLLAVMLSLTTVFLVLARPGKQTAGKAALWAGILLLGPFLLWQLMDGRVLLPGITRTVDLEPVSEAMPITARPEAGNRLVHDLPLTLWTAERLPEARFVESALVEGVMGEEYISAIHVPTQSTIRYSLVVPPGANFLYALRLEGEGRVRYEVRLGEAVLQERMVTAGEGDEWVELTLAPYAGWDTTLELATEPVEGEPGVYWLQPQLLTRSEWLLEEVPEGAQPAGFQFAGEVALAGYALEPPEPRPGEPVTVTLFWETDRPVTSRATVFVHVLDPAGNIVTQHDAQPVFNSYPLPVWLPGMIIADPHPLVWPETTGKSLAVAVGLYDPVTYVRWPVADPAGEPQVDDRAILETITP